MPVTTSGVHAYLTEIQAQLAARTGLAGVQVASGHMGDKSARESIQFTTVTGSQRWGTLGNLRREEEFEVSGLVWVLQPGSSESSIQAVRARAFALLAEVEDELRGDPSNNLKARVSAVVNYELDQGANDIGRWAQIDFVLQASKQLPTA